MSDKSTIEDAQKFLDNPEVGIEELTEAGLINPDGSINDEKVDGLELSSPKDASSENADPGDKGADEESKDKKEKEKEEDSGKKDDEDDKDEGPISTKDGQGTIPYTVLSSTRKRARDAESTNAELTDSVAELTNQNKELVDKLNHLIESVGEDEISDDIESVSDVLNNIDPDKYEETYGEDIGNLARSLKETALVNKSLIDEIKDIRESSDSLVNDKVDADESFVQSIVDENPILSKMQADDPERFEKAVELDTMLAEDSEFTSKSIPDRFKVVVKMLDARYGKTKVPSEDNSDKALEDKISKASESDSKITSLSQINSSSSEESSESEVENLTRDQLHNKLGKMTEDQRKEWLDKQLGE